THVRNRRQAIGILTGCIGLGGIVGAGVSGWLSRISLSAPIYADSEINAGQTILVNFGALYSGNFNHAGQKPEGVRAKKFSVPVKC
ncbi:hypothetical protein MJM28_27280, partial [Salmonella enterica subsp. enterica serovar Montevideo]|nr:hypothetical protein [Salmonella enterica subsp. enterica serovar Montevideo]